MTNDRINGVKPGTSNDDEAARRRWFAAFGYNGDLDEIVTLRHSTLGTATVHDVWAVLLGLTELREYYAASFNRTVNAAHAENRPIDPGHLLSRPEHGPLTNPDTGSWLPGRREIIASLATIYDLGEGEGEPKARFVEKALQPVA